MATAQDIRDWLKDAERVVDRFRRTNIKKKIEIVELLEKYDIYLTQYTAEVEQSTTTDEGGWMSRFDRPLIDRMKDLQRNLKKILLQKT